MLQSCFLPMQISSFEQSSLLRESRGWMSKKLMLSGRSHLAGNFLSRSLPNSICYIAMSVRANGIIRSDADDDNHDDGDGDGKSFCVEDDCWPASCSNLFRLMCRQPPTTAHYLPLTCPAFALFVAS